MSVSQQQNLNIRRLLDGNRRFVSGAMTFLAE
jgi:hypothetical protein